MGFTERGRLMFIGEVRELATLERLHRKPEFQIPAVYGRRRTGKTTLISRFIRNKPTVHFTAIEGNIPISVVSKARLKNVPLSIAHVHVLLLGATIFPGHAYLQRVRPQLLCPLIPVHTARIIQNSGLRITMGAAILMVCHKEPHARSGAIMSRTSKSYAIVAAFFSLVLVLMLALTGCGNQAAQTAADSDSTESATTSDAQQVTYTLKVDATAAEKGMLYDGVVSTKPGTTVYMALIDTGLKLKVDNSSGGVYVDGIDDVVASKTSPNAGWLFTVNGEAPNTDASKTQIADGDVIVWTFTADYTKTQ